MAASVSQTDRLLPVSAVLSPAARCTLGDRTSVPGVRPRRLCVFKASLVLLSPVLLRSAGQPGPALAPLWALHSPGRRPRSGPPTPPGRGPRSGPPYPLGPRAPLWAPTPILRWVLPPRGAVSPMTTAAFPAQRPSADCACFSERLSGTRFSFATISERALPPGGVPHMPTPFKTTEVSPNVPYVGFLQKPTRQNVGAVHVSLGDGDTFSGARLFGATVSRPTAFTAFWNRRLADSAPVS